jgi:hypothetical protein
MLLLIIPSLKARIASSFPLVFLFLLGVLEDVSLSRSLLAAARSVASSNRGSDEGGVAPSSSFICENISLMSASYLK